MKPYLELVKRVFNTGVTRPDRTGTGTISVFGTQTTFDLREGFPATTTKRLAFKAVVSELLGFIKGADNLKDFGTAGAKIWQANYEADYWAPRVPGDLGRIYGTRYRKWRKSTFREQPKPTLREGLKATMCGVANGAGGKAETKLYSVWANMIQRCYNPTSKDYRYYGARGVYVDNSWLEFAVFLKDAIELPNWRAFAKLELDKDKLPGASGFCYSRSTCQWLTRQQNSYTIKPTKAYTLTNSTQRAVGTNLSELARQLVVPVSSLVTAAALWPKVRVVKGWQFESIIDLPTTDYIDQLQELINGLKANPNSRRHVVTMWNPAEDEETVLPPCHYAFQCYVANGYLDLIFVMRSVDLFLGAPFDIASYALLQTMLAREVGLEPRFLTMQTGDTHIYLNHVEQVKEMLRRMPGRLPQLHITPGKTMFELTEEDFALENYYPRDTIKADMAV
jgi:thymidylate synthase